MGYTIAICDDDKNMADKLTVSLKNEFMKAGRNDVIIDYYDTGAVSYTHLTLPTKLEV